MNFETESSMQQEARTEGRLERAWSLVDPGLHAQALVRLGLVPASAVEGVTWRDSIAAIVTDELLAAAGVTIEDVKEAIAFYTATPARTSRETIASSLGEEYPIPKPGWLVTALGYRLGPAGP